MKPFLAVGARLSVGFIALVSLSSCLDITEEIWIEPDGGGRMRMELAISAQMAAMSKLGGGETIENPFLEAEAQLAEDANVEEFEVREFVRDDMTVYEMDVTVKDLAKTVDSFQQSAGESSPIGSPGEGMMLSRLDNGNYRFEQRLGLSGTDEIVNPLTAGLMGTMFQGRHLTIRVHGNIVDANGTIAEDGQSVEWKAPIASLAAGTYPLEKAEAEISMKHGLSIDPKLLMILGAVAGILLIAVIAFRLGKRSQQAA